MTLMLAAMVPAAAAAGEDVARQDVDAILQELADEKLRLAEQSSELQRKLEEMEAQQRRLEDLERQLREAVVSDGATTTAGEPEADEAAKPPPSPAGALLARDDVGDLNAPAVRSGDFPGSFRIPGDSTVSLAIGGFVKAEDGRDGPGIL